MNKDALNKHIEKSEIDRAARQRLRLFFYLCDEVENFTDEENIKLLSGRIHSNFELMHQKLALFSRFENNTKKIAEDFETALAENITLQQYLLSRIETFQEKLKVNTGLQLDALNELTDLALGREVTCH